MKVEQYLMSMGQRPVLSSVPANWITGRPFRLQAELANGAATSWDLTTHDAWHSDAGVRAAYNPTNGSSTRMNATLHLEAVGLEITDGTFSVLTADLKEKIYTSLPSIKATIGGTPFAFPLEGGVRDALSVQYGAGTVLPATTVGARIEQRGKYILPSPVRIDLFVDSLSFASEADFGFGGTILGRVLLWGSLFPNDSTRIGSAAPGKACGQGQVDPVAYRSATLGAESLRY